MHETMSGDINSLGHQLNRFSERNRHFRDFTLYSLISTLKEIIACFPVYRTYVTGGPADQRRTIGAYITEAVRSAKRRAPAVTAAGLRLHRAAAAQADADRDHRGVRGARPVHRQVPADHQPGGGEGHRGHGAVHLQPAAVVERGRRRPDAVRRGASRGARLAGGAAARAGPRALSALSTHDTKRGEDVRARLNVLSEIPGGWKAAVTKWRALNRRFKTELRGAAAPDPNEEYLHLPDAGRRVAVRCGEHGERAFRRAHPGLHDQGAARGEGPHQLAESRTKSTKRRSCASSRRFSIAAGRRCSCRRSGRSRPGGGARHLQQPRAAADQDHRARRPGLLPGHRAVGFHLVDPDNRRPVDYDARRRCSNSSTRPASGEAGSRPDADSRRPSCSRSRTDGRVKLFVIRQALAARARWRDRLRAGRVRPAADDRVAARLRVRVRAPSSPARRVITCVPRMVASLMPDAGAPPVGRAVWADTRDRSPARQPDADGFRSSRRAHRRHDSAEERDGRFDHPRRRGVRTLSGCAARRPLTLRWNTSRSSAARSSPG